MPYFITDQADDCAGWATVKDDGEVIGCHATKADAIAQMVAVSIAEGIEPGGERVAGGPLAVISDIDGTLLRNGDEPIRRVIDFVMSQPGSLFIVTGRLESERSDTEAALRRAGVTYRRLFMKPDDDDDTTPTYKADIAEDLLEQYDVTLAVDDDPANRRAFASLGIEALDPADIPVTRSAEIRAQVPAYMARAAQRGLDLRADGFGGDGLTEQTIREARLIARGEMSDAKVIRANAWAARHAVDLQASQNSDPDDPRWPGAGAVAHYLWGIDPLDPQPARAWLARTAESLQERTMPNKVEKRSITIDDFELRQAGDGMSFTGYAAVFNSPSQPLPFIETIAPGAFKRSLSARNNVRMLLNHDTSRVLGTTRAKTLRLSEDSKGLHVEADLPETTYGRDLSVSMQRGDVDSMSFGFSVPRNGDKWSDDGNQRTLVEVRLHEVSVVTFPAYEATTASVRDYSALALRAEADEDAIAEAMEALVDGSLTEQQADLLRAVVDKAAPQPQPTGTPVSVLQKQLDLIAKSL